MKAVALAALAAAALYVLACPPVDCGPLAFVALAPWCVLARRLRGVRLFLAGTLTGAVLLTFGCMWIARTDPANLVLMVVPESLFFGGFALLLRARLVARGLRAVAALPIAFTAMEFVRGRWPLDGFPWLSFGYTQHRFPWFAQVADLGGVHLVTLLLGVTAGAAADAFLPCLQEARPRGRLRAVLPGVATLLLACGYGIVRRATAADGEPGPSLLLVQPNLPQKLKDAGGNSDEIRQLHLDLVASARRSTSERVDAVVWSETMLTDPLLPETPDARLADRELHLVAKPLVEAVGAPLLVGCVTVEEKPPTEWAPEDPIRKRYRQFNSAVLFDRSGRRAAQYAKRVLVPGGEYLPWIGSMPDALQRRIRRAVQEEAGFVNELTPGRHDGLVELPKGDHAVRVGLTICFEIAYPHLSRAQVLGGATALVNLSNEAWFRDSAEFEQYAAMAWFRAVETRRSVVKVANSGQSGWIGPDGERHLFTDEKDGRRDGFPASAIVRPTCSDETTLYVRTGEWAGSGCSLAALALLLVRRRKPADGGGRAAAPSARPTG
ncbi:MAG TPA: apolipoprotein N-acyltransferase [Planctomycetota bacterium]|nr:apolipoprotein N-acyltransferase [Planctomycetota bacterium]